MSFAIGENVGPYRIVEQLGSGGMATVFKAYHASLDRYVALKVLHPAFKQDPNFLSRFQREARIVANLQHPAIVPVYDFNEHGGQPYLVMRYIEGETLKARLARGELPLPEVRRIMRPVGEALAYAHQQGVLHRDVKPSNILLTPDGSVFLADFGLARIAQAGESTLSQDTMVGTPQYISPEQARGDAQLDARTDIYSLGVVLYELLVGRVPYQADTPYAVIHDHIFTPLPMPRSIKPALPEALERVLLKALAKERDDRYASVMDLITAFDQAAQEVIASAPTQVAQPVVVPPVVPPPLAPAATSAAAAAVPAPVTAPKRSSKKIWIGAAVGLGVIVVAAAIIGIVLSGRAQDAATPPPPAADQSGNRPGAVPGDIFARANDLAATGHPEQAQTEFVRAADEAERILNARPNLPPEQRATLSMIAGPSWLVANQPDRAQPRFEEAMRLMPNNADPVVGLAAAQLLRNEIDRASGTLAKALQLTPDLPIAHLVNACVALKQGDRLRAAGEVRAAGGLDIRPQMPAWIKMIMVNLDCRDEQFR